MMERLLKRSRPIKKTISFKQQQYDTIDCQLKILEKAIESLDKTTDQQINLKDNINQLNNMRRVFNSSDYLLSDRQIQTFSERLARCQKLISQSISVEVKSEDLNFESKQNKILKNKELNTKDKESNIVAVASKTGEFVTLKSTEGKHLQIRDLKDCKIVLNSQCSSLTVEKCTGCNFKFSYVDTSVFLDCCESSEFKMICNQLRLKNCTQLTIEVFVSTDIVMEASKKISFKPINSFDDSNDKKNRSSDNKWNVIKDFDNPLGLEADNFELIEI
ncbi:MAG: hypothetical protein MHPSP_001667 [Paramarteilia canceri]